MNNRPKLQQMLRLDGQIAKDAQKAMVQQIIDDVMDILNSQKER